MAERLDVLTVPTKLVVEQCSDCQVLFAIPEDLFDRAQKWPDVWFWCPNGHTQHYGGKSEAQKLREQLKREQNHAAARLAEADRARAEAEHQRRVAQGHKGYAAKLKKRAAGGACPCCNRTFQDLGRHMKSKHPEFGS